MIAAGIEGGSKRRIEDDWSLADVEAQRAYWGEVGPPPNIAILAIAASLGMDLTKKSDAPGETGAPSGPSIAEIAAATADLIGPGGDTSKASQAVLRAMAL